jgi:hypothetical protein
LRRFWRRRIGARLNIGLPPAAALPWRARDDAGLLRQSAKQTNHLLPLSGWLVTAECVGQRGIAVLRWVHDLKDRQVGGADDLGQLVRILLGGRTLEPLERLQPDAFPVNQPRKRSAWIVRADMLDGTPMRSNSALVSGSGRPRCRYRVITDWTEADSQP